MLAVMQENSPHTSRCLNEFAEFNYIVAEGLRHARRYGEPLSVLRIRVDEDADRFANLVLRFALRQTDVSATLGNGDFAVLLPATDFFDATVVAEKLRSLAEMSIGVASSEDEPDSLMQRAEQALTKAAARGGDRVCF